jgi:hypothetical protein
MRLTHLCLLLACASLSIGVACVTVWQGYPGTAEKVAAALVVVTLAATLRAVWRATGPVHKGGDDEHLRVRSPVDAADACEREAERTWAN